MRDINYQDTQHFERDTMPKLPIQPLLVLCGVTTRFYLQILKKILYEKSKFRRLPFMEW